jgi:ADP-heptose:LPS heptosyltransferase
LEKKIQPSRYRSVLFVKLAEQGSTVLAYEALSRAVERVGRDQVYFLAFEENRFVVDLLGLIPPQNILTVKTQSAWSMVTSCISQLRTLRSFKLDACVDLEFFSRSSAIIAWLTGAKYRVGFHAYFGGGPYRGDLFTHKVLFNTHQHTSVAFTTLMEALDLAPAKLPTLIGSASDCLGLPRFIPESEERGEVHEMLLKIGATEGDALVLLNANAGDLLPLRKWTGRNYVALARRLLAEFPEVFIVFTGLPEEAKETERLVNQVRSPRCRSLAGQTTLRQLMTLYTLADVLVTNDSGPAHFAALTDIEVVVLFGPETPALFAANTPRNHVLWAGLACSPCVNAYNNRQTACRNNLCMQSISVDQVFRTVCRISSKRFAAIP